MLRLCAPVKHGKQSVTVYADRHEHSLDSYTGLDESIICSSNMGKPCWRKHIGHWQRDILLYDWHTNMPIGDYVNLQKHGVAGDYGINVMSANVVAERTFVVGNNEYGAPIAFTANGCVTLHWASSQGHGAVVDSTGQRIYIPAGGVQGEPTKMFAVGESIPFAWHLSSNRYVSEFAAFGTLLAQARICQRVLLWDTRIGQIASLSAMPAPIDGNICTFTGEYMLAVCSLVTKTLHGKVHRTANIRVHDLRSPGTFYDVLEIDSPKASDLLARGPTAYGND